MNLPVLIPAYNPDESLISVIRSLIQHGAQHIIVVNDGSKAEYEPLFDKITTIEQCHVLHHAVNLGKGRAIKTGLNYYFLTFKDAPGIVTADADGQHLAKDIIKVVETFNRNPNALVIGSRKFGKGTPFRSLAGNVATKYVFWFSTGINISDTQSGLRCIPRHIVPAFIGMEGERYEYEMNMLISTKKYALKVIEQEISTVYLNDNKSSHFNPLIDSMKIYFLLLRFSMSSMFASLVDFIVFAITYNISLSIMTSMIIARIFSVNINFIINKHLVFHTKNTYMITVIKFYLAAVVMGSVSYFLIRTVTQHYGVNVLLSKFVIESVLFLFSFLLQRDIIFSTSSNEQN